MPSLLEQIEKAQNNSQEMQKILEKFNPLLKKYAIQLHYEDAFLDLQALLFETLCKVNVSRFPPEDKYILSYLSKSVYKHFLQCIRKKRYRFYEMNESQISGFQLENIYKSLSYKDSYDGLLQKDLQEILNESEYQIIWLYFFKGKTVQEIANQYGITKQAVSSKKTRALKKIRKYLYM